MEIVGREHELEQFHAAMTAAATGQGSTIVVTGEAGMGKSTVVSACVERARYEGFTVFSGQCLPVQDVPFGGLADALRHGLSRLETSPGAAQPGWLARVRASGHGADAAPPEAPTDPVEVARSAAQVLTEASAGSPLLVVVEDMHWADRSTVDAVLGLTRELRDRPAMVVTTVRSPLGAGAIDHLTELERIPGVRRISLHGLSRDYIAAIIRGVGLDVTPAQCDAIVQRSQGNPLFAQELAARGDDHSSGLPDPLRGLFQPALASLPPLSQSIVAVCALAGGTVHHDLLAPATGVTAAQLSHGIGPALAARILVKEAESPHYRVRHPLMAEAIVETLEVDEARVIHRTLANLLEETPALATHSAVEEIAHHWLSAGDAPRARRASLTAAREAQRLGAHAAAARHFERAVELTTELDGDAGDTLGDTLSELAMSAELAGRNGDAADFGWRAIQAPAASNEARALRILVLAEILRRNPVAGAAQQASGLVDEASRLLGDTPGEGAARLALAHTWHWDTHSAQVLEAAPAALAAAQAAAIPPAMCQALAQTGAALGMMGRRDEGLDRLRQAHALAQETGFRVGVHSSRIPTAAMLIYTGDPDAGADEALAGLAELRGVSDEAVFHEALAGLAVQGLLLAGRWDEADDVATDASGDGLYATWLAVWHARLAAFRGDVDTATSILGAAAARGAHRTATCLTTQYWLDLTTEASTPPDLATVARAASSPWGGQPGDINELIFTAIAQTAASPMGSVRKATATLLPLLRANPGGVPQADAWAASARAYATSAGVADGEPRDAWRQAALSWGPMRGWQYAEAFVSIRLAEALSGGSEAKRLLDEAADTARDLGAPPLARLASTAAVHSSIAVPPSDVDTTDRLTPRETQVLALVAEGLSNRRISRELGISEKTVSVHVSNVLRKLGVASRTEAALWASRLN